MILIDKVLRVNTGRGPFCVRCAATSARQEGEIRAGYNFGF